MKLHPPPKSHVCSHYQFRYNVPDRLKKPLHFKIKDYNPCKIQLENFNNQVTPLYFKRAYQSLYP